MKKTLVTGFYLFFAAVILPAQTPDKINRLREVTVTAEKNVRESAVTKTRIDSAQLVRNTNSSFAELLSRHSPVFIKSYGLGSTATVSFRGTAASHTQVEWNGININNPMLGQVDFSLIPVWFVDRAEILHGGSSLQEGSGALGGTIRVGSSPRWDKRLYGSLMQTAGSFGTWQTLASVGGGSRRIQAKVRYLFEKADNDFTYLNTAIPPFERVKQTGADYTKHAATADIYADVGGGHRLSLSLWYHTADRNLPSIMSYEGPGRTETQKDEEFRAAALWNYSGRKISSELSSGYTFTRLDYFLSNRTDLGELVSFDSRSAIHSLYNKYRLEWDIGSRTVLRILANLNYHKVRTLNHITREGYAHHRLEAGLSASIHHRFLPALSGYLLVREDLVDGKFSPVMPSIGFEYRPLERTDLTFKINGTRNYHHPTLNDLHWLPGGNPDLKPEEGYSTDLSARYRMAHGKFSLDISATGYLSWIDNWIVWRPGEFRYWTAENVKKVFARGVELTGSIAYRIGKVQLGLSGNYALTRTTNQKTELPGDESKGRQLIYIPLHKGNLMFDVLWRGFYFNYAGSLVSERFTTSSNEATRHTLPAYDLHNLSVGKRFTLVKKLEIDLQVKIDNLLDKDYQAILWRAMPGRNYTALLKISF